MDQQLPEQPNFTSPKADDEITLKDIILKIQEWFSIVWPHRTKIIALSLAIGLAAALYTKFIKAHLYRFLPTLFPRGKRRFIWRHAPSIELWLGRWRRISFFKCHGSRIHYL
jgi:hypothetical protein